MAEGKSSLPGGLFLNHTVSNPDEFMTNMAKVMDHTAKIAGLLAKKAETAGQPGDAATESAKENKTEFSRVSETLAEVAKGYMTNPEKFVATQQKLWQGHSAIWNNAWQRFLGNEEALPVISPAATDRRFKHEDWSNNQVFDLMKQSYLFTTKWAEEAVQNADGIDEHTRQKARFYVEQIANAISPTNFAFTNPEVLKLTLETNGASLEKGFRQFAKDLAQSEGELRITQTDMNAFAVGENLALSPGKVVFQNDLIQLIQYESATEKVYKKPLLIVPPWINKFYILDLTPEKSFIRWATEQGFTVFVISWVNPDKRQALKTFSDYMHEGILSACSAIEDATGEKQINAIGYCIGGTLLSATLAYLAAKGEERISSATFFTTQVDFEHAGDLKVFVDEEQISAVEKQMAETGFMEGARMSKAFNMLRSNDLIWSYVVNNYLKGKEPFPFDLLYWNGDPTRMPASTHSYYLRECYLNNNMSQGRMVLDGETIDLSKVKIPIYNLATREDHIAPLPSTFKLGSIFGGDTRLVVAGSGHIAGVVNPPAANKYQYWTNDDGAPTLTEWLDAATEHPGSWWPDWANWTAAKSGKKVKARKPGDGKLETIEAAPGAFVTVRS